MNKYNVVIEEGGMRFVMGTFINANCVNCEAVQNCGQNSWLNSFCKTGEHLGMMCISATKISQTKMTREEAKAKYGIGDEVVIVEGD